MTVEVIAAWRNDHVPENIERRRQALDEVIEEIVICISAILKVCAKSRLPFLCLQHAVRIHVAPIESLEVILPNAPVFRAWRKLSVDRVANDIRTIDESHLGIEVRLAVVRKSSI